MFSRPTQNGTVPSKPKVHYAIWSKTCLKPARDLRASWSQTCVRARVVSLCPMSTMLASLKSCSCVTLKSILKTPKKLKISDIFKGKYQIYIGYISMIYIGDIYRANPGWLHDTTEWQALAQAQDTTI